MICVLTFGHPTCPLNLKIECKDTTFVLVQSYWSYVYREVNGHEAGVDFDSFYNCPLGSKMLTLARLDVLLSIYCLLPLSLCNPTQQPFNSKSKFFDVQVNLTLVWTLIYKLTVLSQLKGSSRRSGRSGRKYSTGVCMVGWMHDWPNFFFANDVKGAWSLVPLLSNWIMELQR